ncbi:hypothetical protein AB205_0089650 [Aquarana catesbeiana]|uniref:Uncharacterized protein n=1 Tax=Aquarana catesbeiana TaxID=8400 RepID=A0A2G9Q1N9_AQUCT|nr:hypothetical protein AB205_0089650 [Aquarana catesbeiana]
MEAFWGCNPFLNNKVAVRKGFLPQNTSLDPPHDGRSHMLTLGNLCASSKFGFFRGDFPPSERNIKHSS